MELRFLCKLITVGVHLRVKLVLVSPDSIRSSVHELFLLLDSYLILHSTNILHII